MEQYYYLDSNNQQQGPVDKNSLVQHGVTKQTLVWKAGMANWRPVESIPELAYLFTTEAASAPTYTEPTPTVTNNIHKDEGYFYLDTHNQQQGPIDKSDFIRCGITPQTLVWKAGMAGWQPADTVAELTPLFNAGKEQNPIPPYTPPITEPKMAPGSSGSSYIKYREKPENYLVWAILSTLLCCLPLGIVAIVKASKVNTLWDAQRHEEALIAAEDAKRWCIISAAAAIVIYFFYFIVGASGIF